MSDLTNQVFRSSKDPQKVSLTVKGILTQVAGIALSVSAIFGGNVLEPTVVNELVEGIATIAGTIILLVGQLQTVWGLVRKLW